MLRTVLIAALAATLAACSTSTPGGRVLYDTDTDPPRLKPSEIKLVTYRSTNARFAPEVRTITARDGVVTAKVETRRGIGTGTVPVEEYGDLWSDLIDAQCWDLDTERRTASGGFYHLVTVTLGRRVNSFSAQYDTNFIGIETGAMRARLELANSIARLTGRHVELAPRPEEEPAEGEKKADGDGPDGP